MIVPSGHFGTPGSYMGWHTNSRARVRIYGTHAERGRSLFHYSDPTRTGRRPTIAGTCAPPRREREHATCVLGDTVQLRWCCTARSRVAAAHAGVPACNGYRWLLPSAEARPSRLRPLDRGGGSGSSPARRRPGWSRRRVSRVPPRRADGAGRSFLYPALRNQPPFVFGRLPRFPQIILLDLAGVPFACDGSGTAIRTVLRSQHPRVKRNDEDASLLRVLAHGLKFSDVVEIRPRFCDTSNFPLCRNRPPRREDSHQSVYRPEARSDCSIGSCRALRA
jgi:hypothetical protein